MIRKLATWAAPVGSVAAILCAVIAIMYASSVRVAVSLPTAANIVDASPAQASGPGTFTPADPEVTLVHPLHGVEVFEGNDDGAVTGPTEQSAEAATATGVSPGDDKQPSPSARPTPRASGSKAAPSDGIGEIDDPSTTPSPGTGTPSPTGSWADDDHPSHSPSPSTRPTSTRSPWPTSSHSDDDGSSGGDDGTSNDDGDDATSTASLSP